MSYEVRWRKKGTKTWHHDRISGKKNRYFKGTKKYGGGYVTQKLEAHRTLRTLEDVERRKQQLKRERGSNIEFKIKVWGARR